MVELYHSYHIDRLNEMPEMQYSMPVDLHHQMF